MYVGTDCAQETENIVCHSNPDVNMNNVFSMWVSMHVLSFHWEIWIQNRNKLPLVISSLVLIRMHNFIRMHAFLNLYWYCVKNSFKSCPNDCNISTQGIIRLLGANMSCPFCHPFATRSDMLAKTLAVSNSSQQHPTCCNTLQQDGKMLTSCCTQQCCDIVALKGCNHLAGA